jgi:DNA (cytosine-5)-methyltransferase 1
MKVLNLYACLGGNRLKWTDCEVTAVELDPELARLYQERFPNDTVIVADAHQYLLDHYQEFDFIWSSPPCPTHSQIRHQKAHYHQNTEVNYNVVYSDMKLYQEIILLKHYFKGKYVVENVIPYYKPLIPANKRGRHLYWSNFNLPNKLSERKPIEISKKGNEYLDLLKFHQIDLSSYKGNQTKQKIARNLVDYEAGLTIFNTAKGIHKSNNSHQTTLEL